MISYIQMGYRTYYTWNHNTNKKYNKNVDIKFSAHDTFLEYISSGTLKTKKNLSKNP